MAMLLLLSCGIVLLTLLVLGPVSVGYYGRKWWMVLAVALGAFALTLSFDLVFDGPRIPIILATLSGMFAAGSAALARLGRWGWTGGLLVSVMGALVFVGVFLVDWVYRMSMGFL